MDVREIAQNKILILDGAMGTMIQRHKLEEKDFRNEELLNHESPLKGNNDLLSITQPDIVKSIHKEYFEAGADIAETNTFNANSISQADYALEDWVYRLNVESARLAKEAAQECSTPDAPKFVAGSIGPTNRTASLSPDVNRPEFRAVTFDDLVECYSEQVKGLLEGGVDLLLVETVFDTLNAKAALFAIDSVFDEVGRSVPIMVSGTITDASGRTLSGQTARAFLVSLQHVTLFSIGFNCALGADQLLPHVDVLSAHSDTKVSAHLNAGLPNAMGGYDQTPEEFTELLRPYFERGLLNVVGGCCGTTPEHIQALAQEAQKHSPRTLFQTA